MIIFTILKWITEILCVSNFGPKIKENKIYQYIKKHEKIGYCRGPWNWVHKLDGEYYYWGMNFSEEKYESFNFMYFETDANT